MAPDLWSDKLRRRTSSFFGGDGRGTFPVTQQMLLSFVTSCNLVEIQFVPPISSKRMSKLASPSSEGGDPNGSPGRAFFVDQERLKPRESSRYCGQNPFRTTLKKRETTVCWYLQGNHLAWVSEVVRNGFRNHPQYVGELTNPRALFYPQSPKPRLVLSNAWPPARSEQKRLRLSPGVCSRARSRRLAGLRPTLGTQLGFKATPSWVLDSPS